MINKKVLANSRKRESRATPYSKSPKLHPKVTKSDEKRQTKLALLAEKCPAMPVCLGPMGGP